MYYFLTVFVFLIFSFWMSCTYHKAHVENPSLDDITPTQPISKRSKRSVESSKKPTEKKGSDSTPVQKVADVQPPVQQVADIINVVDVVVPDVPAPVIPEVIAPPLPPPPPPPKPFVPIDSRGIIKPEMTNDTTVSSLRKLKDNLLSPEAFQAISQVMEVDGRDSSYDSNTYDKDTRFVVDFYNPKILPDKYKFITKSYRGSGKIGVFYNEKLPLHKIKNFGNLYIKDIFPDLDIDVDDEYGNGGDMSAYTYVYQNYRSAPDMKQMPVINLILYGVKDTFEEQVSIAGSGTLLISENQNEDTIHFSFGTQGRTGFDYTDRVVLDSEGRPQSGKLYVSYSSSQGLPADSPYVFDLEDLTSEQEKALKQFRIFNIQ